MNEYQTRLIEPGDEAGILRGFREAFGTELSLEEWHWRYRYPGQEPSVALALDSAGEVVSHFGVLPVELRCTGQRIGAGLGLDTYCLRRPGTSEGKLRMRTFHEFARHHGGPEKRFQWLYGFPNERALRGGVRLGYSAETPLVPVWTLPLRGLWSSRLVRLVRHGRRLSSEEVLPQELDGLWAASAHRYPVSIVRDGAWLVRRYLSRPGVSYLHRLVRRDGAPRAWGAFRRSGSRLRWVDLLWDGTRRDDLLLLEQQARDLALEAGTSSLELWLMGDAQAAEVFNSLGWTVRQDAALCLTHVRFDPSIGSGLELAQRLYVTMGISDLD